MIIVVNNSITSGEEKKIITKLKTLGFSINVSKGTTSTVLGLIGDTSLINEEDFLQYEFVEKIIKIGEPYKKANRKYHPNDTIINIGNLKIGGKKVNLIAGPCSVENEEQIVSIAKSVKASGADFLRGGAFKPRTSPYSFQGMGHEGLDLLLLAKQETGLPIVSEIMDIRHLDVFVEKVDIIQVGARNMQNFDLLKELGTVKKPILLKRGLSATIEEWLMSAEHIMACGNSEVILCERGIRTFETYVRNILDISAICAIKHLSHLPIIIDPSHACGKSWMVEALSKAAVVAGCDGLIIEVHNDPANALCDGAQSINPKQFEELVPKLKQCAQINERII